MCRKMLESQTHRSNMFVGINPYSNWIKINCDDNHKKPTSMIGCGCLLKGCMENWIVGCSRHKNIGDVAQDGASLAREKYKFDVKCFYLLFVLYFEMVIYGVKCCLSCCLLLNVRDLCIKRTLLNDD